MFFFKFIIFNSNCNYLIDGLVGEHFVLEIKCPYAAKDTISAIEAMEKKLVCIILLNYITACMTIRKQICIKMCGIYYSCHIVRLMKEKFC